MCHRWWRRGERSPGTRQIGYHTSSPPRPDRRRRHPGDAERQRQGHMDLFLVRYPGPGCDFVMFATAGKRALTVQRHLGAALQSRTQPRRAGLAGLRNASYRSAVLDDTEAISTPSCQAWIDLIAAPDRMRTVLGLSMDHEGDIIGSLDNSLWCGRQRRYRGHIRYPDSAEFRRRRRCRSQIVHAHRPRHE